MRCLLLILAGVCSFPAFATLHAGGGSSARVEIDTNQWLSARQEETIPWQGINRICFYNNQRYSEGAILKTGTVLMQCIRDKNSIGNGPLIWKPLNH